MVEIDMLIGNRSETLCNLAKDVRIIQLENTIESLIGHVEKIKIVNNKIYCLSALHM